MTRHSCSDIGDKHDMPLDGSHCVSLILHPSEWIVKSTPVPQDELWTTRVLLHPTACCPPIETVSPLDVFLIWRYLPCCGCQFIAPLLMWSIGPSTSSSPRLVLRPSQDCQLDWTKGLCLVRLLHHVPGVTIEDCTPSVGYF